MSTTQITSFAEFLQVARRQDQPQRLLFVFVDVELPADADARQRADFEAGKGGALVPVMCVDKSPDELEDFATLATESLQMGASWRLLFAASLSGRSGRAPGSREVEPGLTRMIEAIKQGRLEQTLAFERSGELVSLY